MTPEERECLIVVADTLLRLLEERHPSRPIGTYSTVFADDAKGALEKVQRLMWEANQKAAEASSDAR